MNVGMMMVFASYGWENCSDARVWDEEIRLARLAADLGFDCLWSAEHHFNDYSFVPDNLQLMTYLTALCPNVDLGTAAVILPWHDPLRVAEQWALLDNMSGGRMIFGIGRGLARIEYEGFRVDMHHPLQDTRVQPRKPRNSLMQLRHNLMLWITRMLDQVPDLIKRHTAEHHIPCRQELRIRPVRPSQLMRSAG